MPRRRVAVGLAAGLLFAATPAAGAPAALVEYFRLPGCRDCAEFEDAVLLPAVRAARERGLELRLEYRDILTPDGYERLQARRAELGFAYRGAPSLLVGTRYLDGDGLAPASVAAAIAAAAAGTGADDTPGGGTPDGAARNGATIDARWAAVAGAGLIDGINPCAIAALLFLVSALSLGSGRRSRAATVGAGFIAGVFAVNYLTGLGLLRAGALAALWPAAGDILRYISAAVLLALAALAFSRDAAAAAAGRANGFSLGLPRPLLRLTHRLIRRNAGLWLAGAGSILLGGAVAALEFVCTGQIYLPALVYIARTDPGRGAGLLAVYNTGYILPLAAVYAASVGGAGHAAVAAFFRRRLAVAKVLLALAFIGLALLLFFS